MAINIDKNHKMYKKKTRSDRQMGTTLINHQPKVSAFYTL